MKHRLSQIDSMFDFIDAQSPTQIISFFNSVITTATNPYITEERKLYLIASMNSFSNFIRRKIKNFDDFYIGFFH